MAFSPTQCKFSGCEWEVVLCISQPIPLSINTVFKILKSVGRFTVLDEVIYIFGIGIHAPADGVSLKGGPGGFFYCQFKPLNLINRVRNRFIQCGIFCCGFQNKPNSTSTKGNENE